MDELTIVKRSKLAECEAVIEHGLGTFLEVGQALLNIRDQELYKEYGTFENYCRERWNISRYHAYHLMYAVEVTENLLSSGQQAPLSERETRPLQSLSPVQQREAWQLAVESAANGKVTSRHVEAAVKAIRREEIKIQRESMADPVPTITPPLPQGRYHCIVIDPPWPIEKIDRDVRPNQSHYLDYPVMSLEDIAALPVGSLAYDEGCHLYLWVTQKYLPSGLELLAAWGFHYQCVMTWIKPTGITPYSWMYNTEHVLFATTGGLRLQQYGLKLAFEAPVIGHSVKPDVFYERVALASPGPRLEMFARRPRDGFEVWGNEV